MSLQLYLGHSGHRLDVDTTTISTVEALRTWITQHAHISARAQILLTPTGKQVRTQTLLTERELFVFDSSRLNGQDRSSPVDSVADNDFNPGTPPDTTQSQSDLTAWQSLFRVRKSWASGLLNGCETKAQQADKFLDEQAVIQRSTGVAVASLQQHVKSAEQKYAAVVGWSEELVLEQEEHVGRWENNLDSLRSIPARIEFTRFLQTSSATSRRLSQQNNVTSLQDFVDIPGTRKAASAAQSLADDFTRRLSNMRRDLDGINKNAEELLHTVDDTADGSLSRSQSEPAQLLEEIQMVVRKMASDLEHVQSLSRSAQSVTQASKMALLHTRQYLPSLSDFCLEMNESTQRSKEKRDGTAQIALDHMKSLSNVESQLAALYVEIKGLELPQNDQDAFATLAIISRLPSVYGQLLVESVRRREWVAKMRHDTGILQEEVATYQEEEEKRRKRWMRSVEDVIGPDALRSKVLGIEVSLQNEGGSWPVVSREELQDYLNIILDVYGKGPVTDDMEQAIKDLDKPTKKQIKYAKAFKNGSMHEAAFGDTSLMLRGDEQHKGLKEANARLDEDLRAQKSRVRKLEDLVHRQNQMSRAQTGDMFTPSGSVSNQLFNPIPSSPGELSRNDSMRHRRMSSATQGMEEKRLARRVVDLEAELQAYRDGAASRKTSDAEAQKQFDEAVSTKKDLMENMEAQQYEFATERRNLERELREAKEKLEEMENDLERLIGSRDDERTGLDARVTAFEDQMGLLKEDAMNNASRAATERDARNKLENELEQAERARVQAEEQLRQTQMENEQQHEAEAGNLQMLTTAFGHLSKGSIAPSGIAALAAVLEELARKSTAHVRDLEEAVDFAKSENKSLWTSNERQKAEITAATQAQSNMEEQVRQTKEALATEQAKAMSVERLLYGEQEQLRDLRSKFAEGETGSGVMRQRLADAEAKAGRLSSELAESQSHVGSMEVELLRLQNERRTHQDTAAVSSRRLEKRAERAKDISHRLFLQNARLSRVLERLGLAVSYQDDVMAVERASKMGASTNIIADPSMQSVVSPPPTRKSSAAEEPTEMSMMHWADAQSLDDETVQFTAFLQQVSRFSIDIFSEAVIKRVRDFEYTARKYNKEAKESIKRADAYKERSLKLKTEALAKIAVKDFKDGDLALFLPTRGQAKGAWAAFNIGCPHYFLAEKEGMRLASRDFIVARISRVEQKIVDLSKSSQQADGRSIDETSEAPSFDDDNPFELSDGLTWWMVHAAEERGAGGAPNTPGLGKTTTSSAMVDAKGSIRIKRSSKSDDASKHLNKSLDSRRSSTASKKAVTSAILPTLANAAGSPTGGPSSDFRPRSSSGHSLRPSPGIASVASGLGIITSRNEDGDDDPVVRQHEQIPSLPATTTTSRPPSLADRPRSSSPSKSIRSLQKHLQPNNHHHPQLQPETKSPAKSPLRSAATSKGPAHPPNNSTVATKPAWESLFQADFSIESPSPSKHAGDGGGAGATPR